MKDRRKTYKTGVILRLLLILIFLSWATPALSKIVERIVAIVNDEIITQTDVSDYRKKLKNNQFLDDMLVTDVPGLLEDPKQLVDHLINEKLVDMEVKKQGFTVPEERIEQEIQKIAQGNRISRRELIQALQREQVSFQDYRRFIRTKLERQALIERIITPYIQISDDDIANYYYSQLQKKDTTKAKTPTFEYEIRHVVFHWASSRQRDVQTARSQAQAAHSLLTSGTDFEELLKSHSEEKSTVSGGLLGTFKSNELLADFNSAIQKLKPGEFSQIVRGQAGFHILKLVDKRLIEDPDLTRRKGDIHRVLYQEAFKNRLTLWLNQRRHQSFIKINS